MKIDSELYKIIEYLKTKYTLLARFPDKTIQEKFLENRTIFRILFTNDEYEQI